MRLYALKHSTVFIYTQAAHDMRFHYHTKQSGDMDVILLYHAAQLYSQLEHYFNLLMMLLS